MLQRKHDEIVDEIVKALQDKLEDEPEVKFHRERRAMRTGTMVDIAIEGPDSVTIVEVKSGLGLLSGGTSAEVVASGLLAEEFEEEFDKPATVAFVMPGRTPDAIQSAAQITSGSPIYSLEEGIDTIAERIIATHKRRGKRRRWPLPPKKL